MYSSWSIVFAKCCLLLLIDEDLLCTNDIHFLANRVFRSHSGSPFSHNNHALSHLSVVMF